MTTPSPLIDSATVSVVTSPVALVDLGARFTGILAGAAAALGGLMVSAVIVFLLWNLLGELIKSPTPGKLGAIVMVALLAAFIAGATPSMVAEAYAYGQSFLTEGGG